MTNPSTHYPIPSHLLSTRLSHSPISLSTLHFLYRLLLIYPSPLSITSINACMNLASLPRSSTLPAASWVHCLYFSLLFCFMNTDALSRVLISRTLFSFIFLLNCVAHSPSPSPIVYHRHSLIYPFQYPLVSWLSFTIFS